MAAWRAGDRAGSTQAGRPRPRESQTVGRPTSVRMCVGGARSPADRDNSRVSVFLQTEGRFFTAPGSLLSPVGGRQRARAPTRCAWLSLSLSLSLSLAQSLFRIAGARQNTHRERKSRGEIRGGGAGGDRVVGWSLGWGETLSFCWVFESLQKIGRVFEVLECRARHTHTCARKHTVQKKCQPAKGK